MPQTLSCPRRAVAEQAEGLRVGGDGDVAESSSLPARTRELLSTLLQTNPFALCCADPGQYVLCSHPAKNQSRAPRRLGKVQGDWQEGRRRVRPRGWFRCVCCEHRHVSGLIPSALLVVWGSHPLAELGIDGLP